MAGGKSWIRQALATVFSQWHFHLDLLDLWKNELASTSLALFVMGRPDDLATYQKLLAYYEQLITLFAFDTGYDPLVCIYDGEIRSTPWLYEFFSNSPIYRDVSDRYYNSKLGDVNTQFTEQFLSNLALFWTVIIPDIFAHMGASAPQAIFESKANKLISLRKTTLANAGDFIKWMSHNYSLALKNYAPFVASPELWRAYNPFIDLYWWTLYGHIMCLRAFQSIEASRRIKPFIETQKTVIRLNGNDHSEARLTGDGEITICIPKADLAPGYNQICFNSYNVISCVENITLYSKWYPAGGSVSNLEISPELTRCNLCDWKLPIHVKGDFLYSNSLHQSGFIFWNPGKLRLKIKFRVIWEPRTGITASCYFDLPHDGNKIYRVLPIALQNGVQMEADIPEVEFFWMRAGIGAIWGGEYGANYDLIIDEVSLIPEGIPILYETRWHDYPSSDLCPLTPWPD